MFDNLKNMMGMMGQAKQMREKFAQMQEELGRKIVEGEAGAGAVRVRVNGKFEVVGLHLDRAMLLTLALPGDGEGPSDSDLRMIEDLIAAATNAALVKARELVQNEMATLTGGLNIPGLDKLMGT
jgi:DNA-binding YbaB/EbfC family protein